MPTLKKKDRNQNKTIRRTIRKGGMDTFHRIGKGATGIMKSVPENLNEYTKPTLEKINKQLAENRELNAKQTETLPLRTDYTADELPSRGRQTVNALGQGVKNVVYTAPGQIMTAVGKTAYNAPGVIANTGIQATKSTTRKLYTGLVSAPAKAAVMGYKGVLKPLGRAINNTTRKWVEGKAPIRLRNQELKEAINNFKGIENQWADFHYNENSSMITLAERVEATWQYHKDVVLNVLNRGHAFLLPHVANDNSPINPVKPASMKDETEWNNWIINWKKDNPNRQKWFSQNKQLVPNSVRNLSYDSMGYTHTTMTTDSIQTFFQYLDKGYDDPEPASLKDISTDLQNLEPSLVPDPKKTATNSNNTTIKNLIRGELQIASAGLGSSLGRTVGSISFGGGAAMYDDSIFQSADKYDIAFQGFPDKKFPLKYLIDKNLALESVLERFGVPKNTAQTNFSKSQASPLIQSLKSVLFYPEAVEATPQEEREYGSDVLARVSTALKDDQMNVLNEDGFLPDLFVKSTSDLMPNFYFRRYLPGQKLFPYPGQKPHLTISDNMLNLAV